MRLSLLASTINAPMNVVSVHVFMQTTFNYAKLIALKATNTLNKTREMVKNANADGAERVPGFAWLSPGEKQETTTITTTRK